MLKVIFINILTRPERRVDELFQGRGSAEIENIHMNQPELKNIISDIKNTLEGINIRLEDEEEDISDLEYKVIITLKLNSKEKREF